MAIGDKIIAMFEGRNGQAGSIVAVHEIGPMAGIVAVQFESDGKIVWMDGKDTKKRGG